MGINPLSIEALPYADLTSDGEINVVDIVQLVSDILQEQDQNPDFIQPENLAAFYSYRAWVKEGDVNREKPVPGVKKSFKGAKLTGSPSSNSPTFLAKK